MMATLESFLIEAEDFKKEVYKDTGGKSTIGVGHLLSKSERDNGMITIVGKEIPYKNGLTTMQVMALLDQDIMIYEAAVKDAVKIRLSDNEYIVLVSFCFNVGIHEFQDSTLLKRINEKRFDRVPYELIKWINVGKYTLEGGTKVPKVDKGLRARRVKEIVMWLTGA